MGETLLWMRKEYPQQIVISVFFYARSPYELAKSTAGMYRSLLHQLLSIRAGPRHAFLKVFILKINCVEAENWSDRRHSLPLGHDVRT